MGLNVELACWKNNTYKYHTRKNVNTTKNNTQKKFLLTLITIGLIIFILVLLFIICVIFWTRNKEVSNKYKIMKYIRTTVANRSCRENTKEDIQPVDREII